MFRGAGSCPQVPKSNELFESHSWWFKDLQFLELQLPVWAVYWFETLCLPRSFHICKFRVCWPIDHNAHDALMARDAAFLRSVCKALKTWVNIWMWKSRVCKSTFFFWPLFPEFTSKICSISFLDADLVTFAHPCS